MGERKQEKNECCRMEKSIGKVGKIQRDSDSNWDGERGRDGRDRARKRERELVLPLEREILFL